MSTRNRMLSGWLALGVVWLAMLALVLPGTPILDDVVHWSQVKRFLNGDYRVYADALTNVPGYHWLLTGLLWSFGSDALGPMRVVTALMLVVCVLLFHRIRLRLHPADAQRASAQFFFLPVMFVYGYMAYTDVPALMFLLAALLATIHARHRTSALLLLASMAMRQNHVLWVVFLAVLAAWPALVRVARLWAVDRGSIRAWGQWAASISVIVWPYVLATLCFLAYWAWNGSISYSTAQSRAVHPDLRLDAGNPVYLAALAALLFPLQMAAGGGVWSRARDSLDAGGSGCCRWPRSDCMCCCSRSAIPTTSTPTTFCATSGCNWLPLVARPGGCSAGWRRRACAACCSSAMSCHRAGCGCRFRCCLWAPRG
ncbi:hypothetical protein [Denitratimonas sp. CY0512]|uniref:hypothetical protein n=1 Tax=Denitratimonas sp. CY0512 TaxID=3131940 RepID=UPI0030ACBB21